MALTYVQRVVTSPSSTALRKVSRHLLPLLFVCYVAAYLDRINVGFAQLQMKGALGFGDAVYGLGTGIFFIGYVLFEVPSNLILARTGARIWIARIMITWGFISAAMAFVRTPASFYALRFLLGVAEAGFFPGIIYYLGGWFPAG
jgi:MFS family permease